MRIEYEDRDIIVVYKEAGLPVQTGRTSGRDLVSMLKNHLAKETENAASAGGGSGNGETGDGQTVNGIKLEEAFDGTVFGG